MTAFVVPVACVATVIVLFPIIYLRLVNNHWVSASVYCGLNVVEYGADLSAYTEKRCLFLANHLGLIDHFIIMQGLHNKGRVSGNWMWVIYNIWKYTPLGIMWKAHGNFFINGGASRKTVLLCSFRNHLRNFFYKFDYRWVVMYPEGSRLFLIKDSCARFAKEMKLRPLSNCAYPRTGAAHAVIDVLGPVRETKEESSTFSRCGGGPPIEYIIDATLGYPKGVVPGIGLALFGERPFLGNQVSIHYEVFRVKPEWHDESKLREFLYKRYDEKASFILLDRLLQRFYCTNAFPGVPRPVVVSQFMMLFSERDGCVPIRNQRVIWAFDMNHLKLTGRNVAKSKIILGYDTLEQAFQLFWIGLYYFHYIYWLRESSNHTQQVGDAA
ncbi:Acyltransferase [Dictyocaulus viviparus]|uniref:Acyltransferase n=1 Tax=Dictyocaulus viviparus TaxID=29172 RepID=A0A0D8X7J5_DICVI|nr:Acyltransferase [Dictyocaulus viviparus]